MGIPECFTSWIQGCIESAAFSVSINGELDGFFSSNRGLRQGCPLSPYLFVIAINVLSLGLTDASKIGKIGYHPHCKELHLNHLSFADDLMIFTDGKPDSIKETLALLKKFGDISGLNINSSKSAIYATDGTRVSLSPLVRSTGLELGRMPIRYLGLPLTTKSMTRDEYVPLITKIRCRLLSWTTKALSFAGRLQLIQSVIRSITNFWCSVFRLPNRCFKEIDQMCAAFLWSGSPNVTTKTKVACDEVCTPKDEGGLGIRKMQDSSKTFSLHLIWRLLENTESLWAKWTHKHILRNFSFWDAKKSSRGSWIWNKILKLKSLALNFIKCEVNSGSSTLFWLDDWTGKGRLIDVLGERGIRQLGILRSATVADIGSPNGWVFRRCRDPIICGIIRDIEALSPPNSAAGRDKVLWKHDVLNYKPYFSSKRTWQQIRAPGQKAVWSKAVWFRHALPRQAFITWLAIKDRLATGSRTSNWGHIQACIMCGERYETREHMFFACPFTFTVWTSLCSQLLPVVDPDWFTTLTNFSRNRRSKTDHLLSLMIFQASIYHLWRERNNRIHQRTSNTTTTIARNIRKEISNRIHAITDDYSSEIRTRWISISEG